MRVNDNGIKRIVSKERRNTGQDEILKENVDVNSKVNKKKRARVYGVMKEKVEGRRRGGVAE